MVAKKLKKVPTDSKSISLLAVFSAMVVALEIFPIIGVTDLKIPGTLFTIDWTGIPIAFLFLGFGLVYSFISVLIMTISIMAHGNMTGAIFKLFAELFKIFGMALAWYITRNRKFSYQVKIPIYIFFALLFCTIGMFFVNIILLPILYLMTAELAFATSLLYIPWNAVQSIINVAGGFIIFRVIPIDLKLAFKIGEMDSESDDDKILELADDE